MTKSYYKDLDPQAIEELEREEDVLRTRNKQRQETQFSTTYKNKLNKLADKKDKKDKEDKQNRIYRFCYTNIEYHLCINTIYNPPEEPYFIVWDGKDIQYPLKEWALPSGKILTLPPFKDSYYQLMYEQIIFPKGVILDKVTVEVIDEKITQILKKWFVQPEDYFVVARNYIKFSWVYERFRRSPYLYIYGDFGTGKSEWGKFITWLCQYGLVLEDVSPAALTRILDMTNCSVMLDEGDYIDGPDSDKIRRILRNGYSRDGHYIVAEQADGKRSFSPKVFLVDQPKIIIKRRWTKDDALGSRVIAFNLLPHDKEIGLSMRRDDETMWEHGLKAEMGELASLLLNWRWQNIFGKSEPAILNDMRIRFNDTISPLIKLAVSEDKPILEKFMRAHDKRSMSESMDEFRIQVLRVIKKIWDSNKGIFGPTYRVFLTDIVGKCQEEYGKEMTEHTFKKIFNSRSIRRAVKDIGIDTEAYRNKIFLVSESVADVLPKFITRYNLTDEEPTEEELLKEALKAKIEEHKEEPAIKEDSPVDNLPF